MHNYQTFNLSVAPDSLESLPANILQGINNIAIKVQIKLDNDKLIFLYDLSIPDIIKTGITWQESSVTNHFTDYLWENTCLECFIGENNTASYIEINASTEGNYAIYHFDDYRVPGIMPPRRRILPDNDLMKIHWIPSHSLYCRQFYILLKNLPQELREFDLINPCVILNCLDTPLFFASNHAHPADFHDRKYWQNF